MNELSTPRNDSYFAVKDASDLVAHLESISQGWRSTLSGAYDSGLAAVWYRNIRSYYSNIFHGNGSDSALEFTGSQGEIVRMLVPQARSLNTQFLSLTTKQKINFEPEAESRDALTLSNTNVAQAVIQKEIRDERLDQKGYTMAELATLMGVAYITTTWDMARGRKLGINPETGGAMYNGANAITVKSAYDMVFDHTIPDFYRQPWVDWRDLVNRYDLVAQYPQLEEEIMRLPAAFEGNGGFMLWQENVSKDMVWIRTFCHRTSPALENGRLTVYAGPKCVFFDEENPYRTDDGAYIPVAQMNPEPIAGTGFGYPIFSNILPLQEMLDHNFSAEATNNAALAIKTVTNPSGNNINVKHIGNMKFLSYDPMPIPSGGRPETLDLNTPNTTAERFSERITSNMMQIYNINSSLRGEPPAGVTAGNAIATLSTNALEFSQSFTKAYVETLGVVMTHTILNYRNFGDEKTIVGITGPNDVTIAREFLRSDLTAIKRVRASIANPLLATAAGKLEVANNLLAQGMISTPKKYFRILEGAPLKDIYDKEYSQEQFIQSENDELRKEAGENPKPVYALAHDDHPGHIQGHSSLLDNIEIRNDPERRARIEQHIYEHYQLSMSTDPALAQMIKTGQMPQMPMGGMAPPAGEPMAAPPPAAGAGMPQDLGPVAAPAKPLVSFDNNDLSGAPLAQ